MNFHLKQVIYDNYLELIFKGLPSLVKEPIIHD